MKKIVFVLLGIVLSFGAIAQSDSTNTNNQRKRGFDKDRIFVGGGIGASFGNYTAINVSPVIGYRFTDKFAAGPRIIYNYYSLRGFGSFSNYGAGLMGRYFPKPQFFLQSEYQKVFYARANNTRQGIDHLFVGGGYFNRPVVIYVLYDLLYPANDSPYDTPLQVNIGLMF